MSGRKLKGKVISDKMEKTVVVTVERVLTHPVYGKRVRVTKHYKAHNELGVKEGDVVVIQETRPISREKCWRVVEAAGKKVGGDSSAGGYPLEKEESRGGLHAGKKRSR